MASEKRVKVLSRMSLVPNKPTPTKVHPLSMLDQMMQLQTVKSVYYFESIVSVDSGPRERENVMDRLRESFCKALSLNPVYAGRLRKNGDSGMWEVKCNDAGVRVYEAVCDASLEEYLRATDYSLEMELAATEVNASHAFSPLVVLQFTHFSCGGLTIGLSWLHSIGDPLCGTLLMKTWSEIYRGAQVMHPPFLHPPSLQPRPKSVSTNGVASRSYYISSFLNRREEQHASQPECETVFLRFSHESMENCIDKVQNGDYKFGPATPADALSALLWVAILKAQEKADMNEIARLSVCVEFRKIHVPPIPYGYMGNAVHFVGVAASLNEILGRDLSFAASIVHEETINVDTEDVRSVIDLLQELEVQGCGLCSRPIYMYSAGLTICHFDSFFCYNVCFDFGKPARVGLTVQPSKGEQGLVLILPAAEGKLSRNAVVTLPRDVIHRLLQDPDILSLATIC